MIVSEMFVSWNKIRTKYLIVDSHLNGFNYVPFSITSGIPQGSNLGPLSFKIYTNDLLVSLKSNALGFAYDLKMFSRIDSEADCADLCTRLLLIAEWCNNNCLRLNFSKYLFEKK